MTTASKLLAPSRAVKLCGTESADPPVRRLAAGPLTAELENDQLRYVAFGGVELLRAIAFLVRDEIAARDNPYGKRPADNPDNRRVCLTNADPRQRGLFNAAWTLGYVAACAYGGVAALAMGAATGPLGFVHRRGDRSAPYFDSLDGPAVYPAFHVTAGLARGRGHPLIEVGTSAPGRTAALAWREGGGVVIWLANLTADAIEARVAGDGWAGRRISVVDAASFDEAARNPAALDLLARPFVSSALTLDAYSVARID